MPIHEPALLTSWKEVAAYLGKGVRTVQRWELQLGLPIQRPNGARNGTIQVSREDLDQWLKNGWSRKETVGKSAPTASHQLVQKHSQLVMQMRRSLEELTAQCQALTKNVGEAQSRLRND